MVKNHFLSWRLIPLFFFATVLSACGSTPSEYAVMPDPILCLRAVETSPSYIYYSDLIAELNRRGIDCKEYVGATIRVQMQSK